MINLMGVLRSPVPITRLNILIFTKIIKKYYQCRALNSGAGLRASVHNFNSKLSRQMHRKRLATERSHRLAEKLLVMDFAKLRNDLELQISIY